MGGLYTAEVFFLTVLETGKSKLKAPTDSSAGEGGLLDDVFSLGPKGPTS